MLTLAGGALFGSVLGIFYNLIRYVGSENHAMAELYNRIRVQIALSIRELEDTRSSGGGLMDVLAMDSLKLLLEDEQERLNQTVTELIAKRAITPSMGSSLVNDSVYAHDIAMNLIQAAQVIFATAWLNLVQATQDVMLDRSDLDRIGELAETKTSNG